MARQRTPRSSKPPSVRSLEASTPAESSPLSGSPSHSSKSRDTTVTNEASWSNDRNDHADPARPVREPRHCERCWRFISVSGPPFCARCAVAEAVPPPVSSPPIVTRQPSDRDLAAVDLAGPALPVPQPRPSDLTIPARSWPPKPTGAARQVPPPATLTPPRAAVPDFIIPRPSQLHPTMRASPMPSGVLLPGVRPATAASTGGSRSKWTYAFGILMIAAGLAIGVLIAIAGQLVRV